MNLVFESLVDVLKPIILVLTELWKAYSDTQKLLASLPEMFWNDPTKHFTKLRDRAVETALREIHKFRVCSLLETGLAAKAFTNTLIDKMNKALAELEGDKELSEEYRNKIRQRMFQAPVDTMEHILKHPTASYKADLKTVMDTLTYCLSMPLCFDDKEVSDQIKACESQIEKIESERAAHFATANATSFGSALLTFRQDCFNVSADKEIIELDFDVGDIYEQLSKVAPYIASAAGLSDLLKDIDDKSNADKFATTSADVTKLNVIVSEGKETIHLELVKLKARKLIDRTLSDLRAINVVDLSTIQKQINSVASDAEFSQRLINSVRSGLLNSLLAKIDETIQTRSEVYKTELTFYLDLLKGCNCLTSCFSKEDIDSAVEHKLKKITDADQQYVNKGEHIFSANFESALNAFLLVENQAAQNPTLREDAPWKAKIAELLLNLEDVVNSGEVAAAGCQERLYSTIENALAVAVQRAKVRASAEKEAFVNKQQGSKQLVEFDKAFATLKSAILVHIKKDEFAYIDLRMDKSVLVMRGMPESSFESYEAIVNRSVSLPQESSIRRHIVTQDKKLMSDILIELVSSLLSRIALERRISEYCKSLPLLLDRLSFLDADRCKAVVANVEMAIRSYSAEIERCIQSKELTMLVTVFTTLNTLSRSIDKHIKIDMEKYKTLISDVLLKMMIEGEIEATNGLKSEGDQLDKFKLEILEKFVNIRNEMIKTKILHDFSASQSTKMYAVIKEVAQGIFEGIRPPLAHNATTSVAAARIREIKRAAWIIVKSFHLASLLDMNKVKIRDEFQRLLNGLIVEVREKMGRTVLEAKDHDHLGGAANEAISMIPEFKRLGIELFNLKARGMNFEYALETMKAESISINASGDAVVSTYRPDLTSLRTAQASLNDSYMTHVEDFLKGSSQTKLMDIIRLLVSDLKSIATSLSNQPAKTGQLLGCLFALWSILEAADGTVREKTMLRKPHATQILSILRLIGIDHKGNVVNHLAQVKTGEGKSISLGIIAALYALFGYTVNVICYSPYLSARDNELFRELFYKLSVADKIHYRTISGLVFAEMGDSLPNLTNLVESYLKGNTADKSKKSKDKKLLLIDEVDVFFGEKFYGQVLNPLLCLENECCQNLVQYVFDNRDELLGIAKEDALKRIRQHSSNAAVLREYPNLEPFLDKQVEYMLRDVASFKNGKIDHVCTIVNGCRIGYLNASTGHISDTTYEGYKTSFAWLHYKSKGMIVESKTVSPTNRGLRLCCGSILISALPNYSDILLGLTGSLDCLSDGDRRILNGYKFFQKTYVPSTFVKKQLQILPTQIVLGSSIAKFHEAIYDDIEKRLREGRTQLIVFESYEKLTVFEEYLRGKPIHHSDYKFPEILTEQLTSLKRDGVISRAVGRKKITLMTRTFGRGTDFVCGDQEVMDSGGVHVLLTFFPSNTSEEIQIKGRTCRQDNNGSFKMLLYGADLAQASIATEAELSNISGDTDSLLIEKRRKIDDDRYASTMRSLASSTEWFESSMRMSEAILNNNKSVVIELLKTIQD